MSRRLVALDWDAQSLRAVEGVVGKNTLRVSRVIAASIPADVSPEDPEAFGGFLRRVLAEKRFGTRHALLAVPRDRAILINLRLPNAPAGELSSMVKLQASRELPFSADEAVMDFGASLAHDAPEFLDVTVGAVQRSALGYYRQLAHAAGLHVVRLGLRPNSNLLAVTRGVQPFTDERILFVDITPRTTEINIFRWGCVVFSRSANVAADREASPEDGAGRGLLLEVLRTVEAYRAADPAKIDQVIVAGDTGLQTWLVDALRTRFGAPCSLYDARWTVPIDAERAAQMTGFSAALGLFVGQISPEITRLDFISPKRPVDKAAVRRRQATLAGSAVAVLLAIIWIGGAIYISRLSARSAQLGQQIAGYAKQVEAMAQLRGQIKEAQDWMKQEVVWLDRLVEIVEQMPDNQAGYVTKLAATASARAQEFQLGLQTAGDVVPNDLASRLGELDTYTARVGGSRETGSDPRYPFVADMTVVLTPAKKAPPAGKAATRPAGQAHGTGVGPEPLEDSRG